MSAGMTIPLSNALAEPGLWLQHFTTNEPDDSMLEGAIRAMELVIPGAEGQRLVIRGK